MSEQTSKDTTVRPQDDLFGHVNGAWLASAEIPADLPIAGSFVDLILAAERDAAEILRDAAARAAAGEAAPGSNQQKLGDIFASFMDEDRVEELGAEPLREDLAAVDAVDDMSALVGVLGRFERTGVSGFVGVYVDTDDKDSDRSVVKVSQGGLGLPDESYYREDTFAEIRSKYVAHVAAMLALGGETPDDAAAAADRIMALETRLASGHWDRVASRDVQKTYNLKTRAELADAAPAVDWDSWIAGMGAPDIAFDQVVVRQPSHLDTLDAAFREVTLEDWKAWLRWQVVHEAAPYLSDAFVRENFTFYTKTLSGSEEMRERWKRGVSFAEGALGEALGEEYVARHFPPASKAAMHALVATWSRPTAATSRSSSGWARRPGNGPSRS